MRLKCEAIMTAVAMLVCLAGCSSSATDLNRLRCVRDRILVFIVAGTYGGESFWPEVKPNHVSFGSELRDALPLGSEVYPPLWASSVRHDARMQAAKNLAALIDEKANQFDRVCVVGHSHGGNVALLAAGMCHKRIDVLVCLSTPHLYLTVKQDDGKPMYLPVYCSPNAKANISAIVTARFDTDGVPGFWSNVFPPGMNENDAIRLAQEALEATGHPRLRHDSLFDRVINHVNLLASPDLIITDKNLVLHSTTSDKLRISSHHMIHSRRMGRLVGELLRDGPTQERLAAIASLIQGDDADVGEPIGLSGHARYK
jgi:pimeloyl-ACP methyl ester carboxylesterase